MTEVDWNQLNPAAMWRDWLVKSEAQWSEAASTMLKDERSGGLLKKQVDEARLMQRQFAELAQVTLAAANLPSRSDFEALDERMGRIEDGLAQVSAALVQLRGALVTADVAKPALARPPRTRKPLPKEAAAAKAARKG